MLDFETFTSARGFGRSAVATLLGAAVLATCAGTTSTVTGSFSVGAGATGFGGGEAALDVVADVAAGIEEAAEGVVTAGELAGEEVGEAAVGFIDALVVGGITTATAGAEGQRWP
jgi:hypothetical protein